MDDDPESIKKGFSKRVPSIVSLDFVKMMPSYGRGRSVNLPKLSDYLFTEQGPGIQAIRPSSHPFEKQVGNLLSPSSIINRPRGRARGNSIQKYDYDHVGLPSQCPDKHSPKDSINNISMTVDQFSNADANICSTISEPVILSRPNSSLDVNGIADESIAEILSHSMDNPGLSYTEFVNKAFNLPKTSSTLSLPNISSHSSDNDSTGKFKPPPGFADFPKPTHNLEGIWDWKTFRHAAQLERFPEVASEEWVNKESVLHTSEKPMFNAAEYRPATFDNTSAKTPENASVSHKECDLIDFNDVTEPSTQNSAFTTYDHPTAVAFDKPLDASTVLHKFDANSSPNNSIIYNTNKEFNPDFKRGPLPSTAASLKQDSTFSYYDHDGNEWNSFQPPVLDPVKITTAESSDSKHLDLISISRPLGKNQPLTAASSDSSNKIVIDSAHVSSSLSKSNSASNEHKSKSKEVPSSNGISISSIETPSMVEHFSDELKKMSLDSDQVDVRISTGKTSTISTEENDSKTISYPNCSSKSSTKKHASSKIEVQVRIAKNERFGDSTAANIKTNAKMNGKKSVAVNNVCRIKAKLTSVPSSPVQLTSSKKSKIAVAKEIPKVSIRPTSKTTKMNKRPKTPSDVSSGESLESRVTNVASKNETSFWDNKNNDPYLYGNDIAHKTCKPVTKPISPRTEMPNSKKLKRLTLTNLADTSLSTALDTGEPGASDKCTTLHVAKSTVAKTWEDIQLENPSKLDEYGRVIRAPMQKFCMAHDFPTLSATVKAKPPTSMQPLPASTSQPLSGLTLEVDEAKSKKKRKNKSKKQPNAEDKSSSVAAIAPRSSAASGCAELKEVPLVDKELRTIVIENITLDTSKGSLKDFLEAFGQIDDIQIISSQNGPAAEVTFRNEEQIDRTVSLLHNSRINPTSKMLFVWRKVQSKDID